MKVNDPSTNIGTYSMFESCIEELPGYSVGWIDVEDEGSDPSIFKTTKKKWLFWTKLTDEVVGYFVPELLLARRPKRDALVIEKRYLEELTPAIKKFEEYYHTEIMVTLT